MNWIDGCLMLLDLGNLAEWAYKLCAWASVWGMDDNYFLWGFV